MAASSPGGTSNPLIPSSMSSGSPPVCDAMKRHCRSVRTCQSGIRALNDVKLFASTQTRVAHSLHERFELKQDHKDGK